jgi:hypothetical protein
MIYDDARRSRCDECQGRQDIVRVGVIDHDVRFLTHPTQSCRTPEMTPMSAIEAHWWVGEQPGHLVWNRTPTLAGYGNAM